jgi:two-component system, cell cycle response regulator
MLRRRGTLHGSCTFWADCPRRPPRRRHSTTVKLQSHMHSPPDLTPLVLLVDDQEWTSRSIESILRPKGHVVLKAYTGQQALDLVQKVSPDALLVDLHLPDIDGIDLVRRLRACPTIQSTTPVLMITGGSVSRAERLEALGAGAWDILTHPVDPNELILRMETFVRAKHDADRLRDEGLTDPVTGFYNARGILRRTKEIGADAVRSDRPLTCIAFGPQSFGEGSGDLEAQLEAVSKRVAAALRAVTRISDTVGRLGPGEFVVVAPGTDQGGAVRLADRVFAAVEAATQGAEDIDPELLKLIRAGFYAVQGTEPTTAEDLLLRATMALRKAQADNGSFRVRAYDA